MKFALPFLLPILFALNGFSQINYTFIGANRTEPALVAAVADLDSLTKAEGISVSLIIKKHDPGIAGQTVTQDSIHYVYYPDHSYYWTGSHPNYQLTAHSVQGLNFGIYGLLDEVLGFRFIHPCMTSTKSVLLKG